MTAVLMRIGEAQRNQILYKADSVRNYCLHFCLNFYFVPLWMSRFVLIYSICPPDLSHRSVRAKCDVNVRRAPMSILVVEDHVGWREAITEHIEGMHLHEPVLSTDSLAGLDNLLSTCDAKVLILDAGLPDGDGLAHLVRLRMAYPSLGIVMLTGRVRTADKVTGLKLGADYYLTKPLNFPEFEATLITLLRRLSNDARRVETSEIWRLDRAARVLIGPHDGPIELSESECKVFAALAHAAPLPVSRRELIQALGERPETYDAHRLDALMHRLRRKISDVGQPGLTIKTVYGSGYACTARVAAVAP